MQPWHSDQIDADLSSHELEVSPGRLFSAAETVLATLYPETAAAERIERGPSGRLIPHLPLVAFTHRELVIATEMLMRMGYIESRASD